MGHITVLVQHAWAMHPTSSASSVNLSKVASSSQHSSPAPNAESSQKKFLDLKNKVRVSNPVSIADFVHEYHKAPPSQHPAFKAAITEFVNRLESMVTVAAHPCPLIKTNQQLVSELKVSKNHGQIRDKVSSDPLPSHNDTLSEQKRAATVAVTTRGCRLSLLLIGQTPDPIIQTRSASLLYTYLETNRIQVDMPEFEGLCELLTEMANVVCHVVENDVSLDDPSKRLDVSSPNLFTLFKSISLVCERIDLIRDALHVDLQLENKETVQGFRITLAKLQSNPNIAKDSPIEEILSLVQSQLLSIVNTFQESEEAMTASIGISFLSSLIRKRGNLAELPKSEIQELLEPYVDIMHDIKDKQRYLMGRKFIRIVSTVASINLDTLDMYLEFVANITQMDYTPWIVDALYTLAIVSIHSRSISVRRHALTKGLLAYVDHSTWQVRRAAIIALSEIVSRRGREPDGLMATEVIRQRQQTEDNQYVQETIKNSFRKVDHPRVSHFYWHGNFFLADSYADSQNEYRNLRKYVKSVDRGPLKMDRSLKNSASRSNSRVGPPDPSLLNRTAPFNPHGDTEFVMTNPFRQDQIEIPLQLGPYHRNYKHVSIQPGETLENVITRHFTELALEEMKSNHPDAIYPSSRPTYTCDIQQSNKKNESHGVNSLSHDVKPAAGTVNSRKLFNANRSKLPSSTRVISKQPPLKFAKGRVIQVKK